MKVPVSSSQNNNNNNNNNENNNNNNNNINNQSPNLNPKQSSNNNNTRNIGLHQTNGTAPNLCYEPTSVLELRRSPSPVSGKPVPVTEPLDCWDEHALQNFDWDSIMRELDLENSYHHQHQHHHQIQNNNIFSEFPPQQQHQQQQQQLDLVNNLSQFMHSDHSFNDFYNLTTSLDLANNYHGNNNLFHQHQHQHNYNNSQVGFDSIQELIRAADCFDSNDLHLAHAILERLNQRLQQPTGKPLQRAAFFFKEALQSLLTVSTRLPARLSSWSELVHVIKAYKAFSSISPIPMFTHFTANQALLEALFDGGPSPSPLMIHVVDFDISLACMYPSFMKELAQKLDTYRNNNSVFLRLTAVVGEDYAMETQLVRESLSQFANDHKIRFQIDFVLFRTFEMLSFKAVKFVEGEKTAVLLSPTVFNKLSLIGHVTGFVTELRRVSPDVVVCVESEGCGGDSGTASFRRNFVSCLEFYSMVFESLDAAAVAGGGGDWGRKIEMFLMKPRIFAAVEGCGRRAAAAAPWREVLCGAGLRPVQLSHFADFQAECLLRKVPVGGFDVAKRQAELLLCWHQRPLVATSAWKL